MADRKSVEWHAKEVLQARERVFQAKRELAESRKRLREAETDLCFAMVGLKVASEESGEQD